MGLLVFLIPARVERKVNVKERPLEVARGLFSGTVWTGSLSVRAMRERAISSKQCVTSPLAMSHESKLSWFLRIQNIFRVATRATRNPRKLLSRALGHSNRPIDGLPSNHPTTQSIRFPDPIEESVDSCVIESETIN